MTLLMLEIIALFLAGIYVGVEVNHYLWLRAARTTVNERMRMAELERQYGRRAGIYKVRG